MSETASEIDVLRAALAAAEARAAAAEGALVAAKGELTQVQAVVSAAEEMILHLWLQIAKLRREQYGQSAERHARLIEQLEMQLEDLEADLGEDCAKADALPAKTTVTAFDRRRPARKPFPDHLPRERVVVEAPVSCTCCGSARIVRMGEVEEGHKTVRGTVLPTTHRDAGGHSPAVEGDPDRPREPKVRASNFTCRDCEKISQPPRAVPPHAAGMGRSQSAGHGAL